MCLSQRWTALLFGLICQTGVAAEQTVGQSVPAISLADRLQWLVALLIVLGLFFLCIWILRKVGAVSTLSSNAKLYIVTGTSLGVREKVVVLQVGNKQLVLAVTPGRIETLTVLEGNDCLETNLPKTLNDTENSFAQKLMQAIKGQSNA